MRREEFTIGKEFDCGGKRWRCTDVGSRVITAICISDHGTDPSGPPYSINEDVFDENDLPDCTEAEATTPQSEAHPQAPQDKPQIVM
jgi:hypothetical protein